MYSESLLNGNDDVSTGGDDIWIVNLGVGIYHGAQRETPYKEVSPRV